MARQIGELIAARVQDHSTLQLGIGAVPDAVLASLTQQKGLRIWTEMFSDGVLELHRRDALDREVPITASFIFGSAELYEWIHLNKWIRMLRTERTNDPGQIARQAKMTSVNAALQVDLFDQANASRVKGRIYSGFGGSTDFIVGALHSRGGQSFIALPSWHKKADVSTIVPRIQEPVTSFEHSAVRDRERHRVGVRTQPERARHEHHRARRPSATPARACGPQRRRWACCRCRSCRRSRRLARYLDDRTTGSRIASVTLASLSALKTFDPPFTALEGAARRGRHRRGKFLDLSTDGGLHLVWHLSRAAGCSGATRCPRLPVKPGKGPLALRRWRSSATTASRWAVST